MAVIKSDIKFYLTSIERDMEQTIYSQSLGGFDASVSSDPTLSLVYPETSLSNNVSLYGTTIGLSDYSKIQNFQYVNSNFEIIKANPITGSIASISERGINKLRNVHLTGDIIRGLPVNGIFNDNINDKLRQYRCIAMKNTNATDTAYNCVVYLKQNSRNPGSKIRIALERPQNDRQEGTATGGTKLTLIDTSLISLFDNNHFSGSVIEITEAAPPNTVFTRTVLSFDSSTGTIVLDSSLSQDILSGDTYTIHTAAGQRVPSGLIRPVVGSGLSTSFSEASQYNSISINTDGSRAHGEDLMPNDVIYIWLEREIKEDSGSFDFNNVIITCNFYTVT